MEQKAHREVNNPKQDLSFNWDTTFQYLDLLCLCWRKEFAISITRSPVLPIFAGLPDDTIKMAKDIKPVVEIQQKGNDFVVTSKTPNKSVTNSFTLGKEADITTMDGRKLKVKYSRNGHLFIHP